MTFLIDSYKVEWEFGTQEGEAGAGRLLLSGVDGLGTRRTAWTPDFNAVALTGLLQLLQTEPVLFWSDVDGVKRIHGDALNNTPFERPERARERTHPGTWPQLGQITAGGREG